MGCDRTPFPYYRAKAATALFVRAAQHGHVVRATQFHRFLGALVRPLPVLRRAVVPAGWQVQPVAKEFVAQVLVDAVADPAGAPFRRLGEELPAVTVPSGRKPS